jgi:NTP pyrophosphatase (non-canonical NTP hydrolase)
LAAGWWNDIETNEPLDRDQLTPTKLLLAISEITEAMEGHRKDLMDDKLPHRPMIECELADAVIRIGDLGKALNLDVGGAIAEKMEFNKTRPDHKVENRRKHSGKKY